MSSKAFVRHIAAGVREGLAAHCHNRGPEFGARLARRIISECVSELIEIEGRRKAYGAVLRISDRIVMGRLLEDDDAAHFPAPDTDEPEEPEAQLGGEPCIVISVKNGQRVSNVNNMTATDAVAHLQAVADALEDIPDEPLPWWRRALQWACATRSQAAFWGFLAGFVVGSAS